MARPALRVCCFALLCLTAVSVRAQYKLDHLPGLLGLESGTQAPPGLYVGNLVYVYPTSTIKDNNGNSVHLPGSITATADAILVSVVTNYKFLGGDFGASIAFPWMEDLIQANSLNINSGFAYTIYRHVRWSVAWVAPQTR